MYYYNVGSKMIPLILGEDFFVDGNGRLLSAKCCSCHVLTDIENLNSESDRICKECRKKRAWKCNWKVRVHALMKLGGKCIKCGIQDFRLLTINHKIAIRLNCYERAAQHQSGPPFHRRIVNGDIDINTLNILCYNCHRIYDRETGMRGTKNKMTKKRIRIIEEIGAICVKCSKTDMRFLQISHLTEKGVYPDRHSGNYYALYREIELSPELFEIRCANCNWLYEYEIERLSVPHSIIEEWNKFISHT